MKLGSSYLKGTTKFLNDIFKYVWNKKIESFGPNNTTLSFLIEDNSLERWQAIMTWKKKKKFLEVNLLSWYNER